MDDAVLSAGSLLLSLIKKRADVLIITVFTQFGTGIPTWDSLKYIIKSGNVTTQSFEKKRVEEDRQAMHMLGARSIHLPFIDGGFRKKQEGGYLYPDRISLFSGYVHKEDRNITKSIKETIQSYCSPQDILYAPLAIGSHADHIIINRIVKSFHQKTYFWLDQPYAENSHSEPHKNRYTLKRKVAHDDKKDQLIHCYSSQVRLLYPKGIPHVDELFFIKA
jgi:LmbE family N-acetylglucosaminyl deacetylase